MAKLEFTQPPTPEGEAWKPLPVDGVWVSDYGRIWIGRPRARDAGMARQHESGGYLYVRVRGINGGKRVGVHRLVAHAFHGECPDGMCVDHIDSNPENNRPENLQYVTPMENVRLYWQRRREMHPLQWKHRQLMRSSRRLLRQADKSLARRGALIAALREVES